MKISSIAREKVVIFLKDPFAQLMVKIFLLVILFFLTIIILKWPTLPPQLPLFYSLPKGSEQLGTPLHLLLLPLFSLIFFGVNFMVASFYYPEERLGSNILIIISMIVTLLLLIALVKIILLVS